MFPYTGMLYHNPASHLPDTISAGYGELSWQGFDKITYWMQHEAPDFLRINQESTFLDIGSGFGKCVFHAKIRTGCKHSIGIECIQTRHQKALEVSMRWDVADMK